MSNYPKVYNIVAKNDKGEEFIYYNDNGQCYFVKADLELELANARKRDSRYYFYKEMQENELNNIFKDFNFNPFEWQPYEKQFSPNLVNELINYLKDEKSDIKEEKNMAEEKTTKREEVAVSFYEGMVSKKIINLKKGDATIKLKRVKMPNDDPKDSTPRRAFLVAENKIYTDKKNPHMQFTYLGKDQEYKVVRNDFNPETKENKVLEETKMTGAEIASVFKTERDRQYADYKATQPVPTTEIDTPYEDTIEDSKGIEA